jgi:hypothetical protein
MLRFDSNRKLADSRVEQTHAALAATAGHPGLYALSNAFASIVKQRILFVYTHYTQRLFLPHPIFACGLPTLQTNQSEPGEEARDRLGATDQEGYIHFKHEQIVPPRHYPNS